MPPDTGLDSFVLRFVYDSPADQTSRPVAWHGVIRHVQSDAECHFTRWEEAATFVAQFVGLEQTTDVARHTPNTS